jgi:hypothetical protein
VTAVQSSQEHQPSRTGRLPRRSTDRLEDAAAWILAAAGLFMLLWAVLGGVGVYGDAVDRGRAAERDRVQVDAVLITAAELVDGGPGSLTLRPARYVDSAGREQEIRATVAGRPPVGTTVHVWVNGEGKVVPAPLSRMDAFVLGVAAATGIGILGGSVLGGLWVALRRWVDHRNVAGWAREWAQIEPVWSGRPR